MLIAAIIIGACIISFTLWVAIGDAAIKIQQGIREHARKVTDPGYVVPGEDQ